MENASKALIMAGGVLISLIIIGVLVISFNNLSEWQKIEQSGEKTEQAAEFNKQYEVYLRDVYGSELLSIASKVQDYNKRKAENKGYTKIELYVEITSDMDNEFFNEKTYTSTMIKEEIDNLEDKIKEIGRISIESSENSGVSRKISQLATMRTKDIEELGIKLEDYSEMVSKYNTYKTLLTQVKSKIFKYVNFEYDEYNGRIIKMKYQL